VTIPRDPHTAPARPDLTFLRHRGRPAPQAPPPPPVPVVQRHPEPPPAPPSQPLAPPASRGSSLDLTPPAPAAGRGSSLDLTPPAAPPVGPASSSAAATRHKVLPVREARRAPAGAPTRLAAAEPTVTLTRVQSATGALELALTRASSAGDLSMGCVFQLADGTEAIVQALGDVTAGPPGAVLPLVRYKHHGDSETLHLDLRQVGSLRRALIYAYSPSIAILSWQGVLVATTYGGARIEIPFDRPPFSGTLALLTIYNVDGELVLRAEMEDHHGPPEMAAKAFDHHLAWLEGRQPLG
jgi:uncharacterized protein involved in tellurium resistance